MKQHTSHWLSRISGSLHTPTDEIRQSKRARQTARTFAFAVAASLTISGCASVVRFRPLPQPPAQPPASVASCEASDTSKLQTSKIETVAAVSHGFPLPVTASSPFVRVVGESAPETSFAELELLAAELHSELAFRGGVRLEESALVAQQPQQTCAPASCPSRNRSADGDNDKKNGIKKMAAQLVENSQPSGFLEAPQASAPQAQPASGNFEVAVILNDFTPYRPMQLAATMIVRDLSTGHEIHRIQQVWRGIVHEPEFETTRRKRNEDLRHPVTRQRLEQIALPDISPRHLIKRVAGEVADSLHQSVLKPHTIQY